jgi:signal transduction histidine kinase
VILHFPSALSEEPGEHPGAGIASPPADGRHVLRRAADARVLDMPKSPERRCTAKLREASPIPMNSRKHRAARTILRPLHAESRPGRISTLDQLSTALLHDLRNPLASICGCSEMLVDLELTPDQVKRLSRNIHRAADRMRELLGNLFDVTQGKTAEAETCSIREMIVKACEYSAAPRDQGIQISLDLQVQRDIRAVRNRMERVFINLVTNAVEAMPQGGKIRIAAKETGDCALIEVEDSGPGIPLEIRDRLFQPFISARKKDGLGLGLSTSIRTVRDHGGEMWTESAPGARFVIRLPLQESVTRCLTEA